MGLCAKDVMQTSVRSVSPDMRILDLEETFVSAGVTGFPVVENDRLVGVVSRSDVVRRLVAERSLDDMVSDYYVDLSGFDPGPAVESLADVAARFGAKVEKLRVADLMTRATVTTAPDTPIAEVAGIMCERRVHRLPVTEGERLVGIVTSLDLVRLVAEGGLGTD